MLREHERVCVQVTRAVVVGGQALLRTLFLVRLVVSPSVQGASTTNDEGYLDCRQPSVASGARHEGATCRKGAQETGENDGKSLLTSFLFTPLWYHAQRVAQRASTFLQGGGRRGEMSAA